MRKPKILLLAMVFTLALSTSVSLGHASIQLSSISISDSGVVFPGGSTTFNISSIWYQYGSEFPAEPAELSITMFHAHIGTIIYTWYNSYPDGVNCYFNTTTLNALPSSSFAQEYISGDTASLTITTPPTLAPGEYTFTILAMQHSMIYGDIPRYVNGTLTVRRPTMGGLWEAAEDLIAGKNTAAGQLLMYDTDRYLVVNFGAKPDWRITETHLAVATSLDGIPQTKKGNPIPGQFQYKNDTLNSVESYQYRIPMTWPSETTLYIAAHCVVEGVGKFSGQTESAWAGNLAFPGCNWANFTIYFTEYRQPMGYS